MKKRIILDRVDVLLLNDVLEYILFQDDRELIDLAEQLNVDADELLNEHGILILEKIPKEYDVHIYVKAFKLFDQLKDAENE